MDITENKDNKTYTISYYPCPKKAGIIPKFIGIISNEQQELFTNLSYCTHLGDKCDANLILNRDYDSIKVETTNIINQEKNAFIEQMPEFDAYILENELIIKIFNLTK